jgi:hypothetical protein
MSIVADDGPNGRLISRRATRRRAQQFSAEAFVERLDEVMDEVVQTGSVSRPMQPLSHLPVAVPAVANDAMGEMRS